MEIQDVPLSRVWQLRQQVMYPNATLEAMKLPDDEEGRHLGIYKENEVISLLSLFERGDEWQFRKFATVVAEQGKGYGSRLLSYIMEEAARKGVKRVWCNARLSATALYERFGMKPVGNPWQKNGLEFIIMEKN